jgi:hypothetical protein
MRLLIDERADERLSLRANEPPRDLEPLVPAALSALDSIGPGYVVRIR